MEAYGITTKDLLRGKAQPAKRAAAGASPPRSGARRKSANSGIAVPATQGPMASNGVVAA